MGSDVRMKSFPTSKSCCHSEPIYGQVSVSTGRSQSPLARAVSEWPTR